MRRTIVSLGLVALLLAPTFADDEKKKARYPTPPSDTNVTLFPAAWKSAGKKILTPEQLDKLLADNQKADKLAPLPIINDEQFLRRVTLHLVGRIATTKEISTFVSATEADKRAKLIDKLLASEEFARHKARYWRDIIVSRATEMQGFVRGPRDGALEDWLFTQFKDNVDWAKLATALITSESSLNFREPRKGGDAGMLLCHTREDGPTERTNDTVRIFMGINLQCAQCHDHPDDIWKRDQFHQMAAFYGKLGDRIKLEREPINFITSLGPRFFEYRMPDRDNPKKTYSVKPKFLTGETPKGRILGDKDLRKALAGFITDKENYYFSAAFVNRLWGELIGQAFVMPVDNLGPLQPALYGDVLLQLADSFRASDYDIRAMYRLIMNSKAYQQKMRMGEQPQDHLKFVGSYPTRLGAQALWDSLNSAVGTLSEFGSGMQFRPGMGVGGMGPFGLGRGLRGGFMELFKFDPSAKPEDVEGSVVQSLFLMNNAAVNAQIKGKGNTVLARVLRDFPKDEEAINQVYLRSLGRSPTEREKKVCLEHLTSLKDRVLAFEDIQWSLINSAEFRTKR
jgi:hypothetical protein